MDCSQVGSQRKYIFRRCGVDIDLAWACFNELTIYNPFTKSIYVRAIIYHSPLLNERNIEYYPYPKYWVYDNIYLNLLTLENMKGSVITRYEKDIETID